MRREIYFHSSNKLMFPAMQTCCLPLIDELLLPFGTLRGSTSCISNAPLTEFVRLPSIKEVLFQQLNYYQNWFYELFSQFNLRDVFYYTDLSRVRRNDAKHSQK